MRFRIVRTNEGTIKPYDNSLGWEEQDGQILDPFTIEVQSWEKYGHEYKPKGSRTVMLFATDGEAMYHNDEMVDRLQDRFYYDAGGLQFELGESLKNCEMFLYDFKHRSSYADRNRPEQSSPPRNLLSFYSEPVYVAYIPSAFVGFSGEPLTRPDHMSLGHGKFIEFNVTNSGNLLIHDPVKYWE